MRRPRAACRSVGLAIGLAAALGGAAPRAAAQALDGQGDAIGAPRAVLAPPPPPPGLSERPGRLPGTSALLRLGLDARHGADASTLMATGDRFALFRSTLTELGADIVPLASFLPADLDGLDALILNHAFVVNGLGYSAAEMDAIHAFVATGGSLMAHAEAGGGSEGRLANLNALVAPYGVVYSDFATEPGGHVVRSFVAHAITTGVAGFGVDYQRRMTITAPAIDLSVGSGPDDALAAVPFEAVGGCVVLVSDTGCWHDPGTGSDQPLTSEDNRKLLANVIRHFRSCGLDCSAPPAPLGNVLKAVKAGGEAIRFLWPSGASFDANLRRDVSKRFDRATAELLGSSPAGDLSLDSELHRAPDAVYYQAFAVSCSGSEE